MKGSEIGCSIGKAVEERRERKDMTRTELARRMESHVSTISKLERGQPVRLSVLYKLAAALGVQGSTLLQDAEKIADRDRNNAR